MNTKDQSIRTADRAMRDLEKLLADRVTLARKHAREIMALDYEISRVAVQAGSALSIAIQLETP